ncbi:MAG: SpoIVB peptidase S55 domain-containing protein [Isosphaeraceae bacterium]
MRPRPLARFALSLALVSAGSIAFAAAGAYASEPDASRYWKVDEIRAGMKGTGQTVMVGTRLEQFGAEVLGVMKGVSPGRDMVLCRLTGCNLEHAGIIQGMSGSPIMIEGKLLGAVAFAWEFAKDPIAGVTPFEQMVAYVRSSDRRIAAESKGTEKHASLDTAVSPLVAGLGTDTDTTALGPITVSGGGLAGMKPIATPLAATGFSPRALALLEERFRPIGLAPMAGGSVTKPILQTEGDKPLVPGAPLSIAMVTGDFDLSGIGTVTHVEGNRVYGFGHPMMSLGSCEFPMMTGYIHTVYPRASVSMKMGSPLKVVGVIDTDVSTGVAGRIGPKPDMLPMSVRVKMGQFSDPKTYRVEMVREPNLMPSLVMSVLTNAIDTEGNLPEELTAHLKATIRLKGHAPIVLDETLSGPRYTGPMGPASMFNPIASIVNIIGKNPMEKVRLEAIDCELDVAPGRSVATIESVRLESDRVEPGQTLVARVELKPFKGPRETRTISLAIPRDLPEGSYEAAFADSTTSLRRRLRNEPGLTEPRDLDGLLRVLRLQTEPRRTAIYLHVALPDRGLAVQGQPLPNLPGSARAVFATNRVTQDPTIRADLVAQATTPWVVEGGQSLRFTVVKDAGLSLK